MDRMKWENLFSRKRYGLARLEQQEAGRSHFQKDIDRIIFSNAFRRLNDKTQVYPLSDNDNIRTRLPHSLEASSVGRSLGTKIGERLYHELKYIGIEPSHVGDIVQAACLAHDIGNPPFGHSGEDAIRDWFRKNADRDLLKDISPAQLNDFQNFEGNAQGLRIVTQLEYYLFQGGMRLTYATLGAFMKYPWTSDLISISTKKKYGCNVSESKTLVKIATELGLIQRGTTAWCRHPISYLMEAADDICYASIDLEDAIEMGFMTYDEVFKIFGVIVDLDRLPDLHPSCQGNDLLSRQLAIVRGRAINVLIEGVVDTFMQNKDDLLMGNLMYEDLIKACGGEVREFIELAKSNAKEKIFDHPRKMQIDTVSHARIETILAAFIEAAYNLKFRDDDRHFSDRDRYLLDLMGNQQPQAEWSLERAYINILDFVSGMTDKYAANLAKKVS